jgi:phytoene dehydrogenase-like protein
VPPPRVDVPPGAVDVVVGAGHNGLVAACYLAREGREVVVLEAQDRPGGGSRTEETVPGYRFDMHSVAHNIINMTEIPVEFDLAGAGLVYQEMDPFSVAVHADGRRVPFHRDVEATVASIAEVSPSEARAYQAFVERSVPVVQSMLPAIRGQSNWRETPGRLRSMLATRRTTAPGIRPGRARSLRHPPATVAAE